LQWDLPGGLLDEGEELSHGVAREVREEAGLLFQNGHVVYAQTEVRKWIDDKSINHETNNVWLYYAGSTDTDKVTLSYEHSEFVWVSIDEAIQLLEYQRQIDALTYILDNQLEL
jgi:8-oxo-dGTP pyrophosphatase MutT (NUDIX family)